MTSRKETVLQQMKNHNCTLNYNTVKGRLLRGWPVEKAMTEKPVVRGYKVCENLECCACIYNNTHYCPACGMETQAQRDAELRANLNAR